MKKLFALLSVCVLIRATFVDPTTLDACPGYHATNVQTSSTGLTAKLVLGGTPCNVFGDDIKTLSLSVVYETSESSCFVLNVEGIDKCFSQPHPPQNRRRVI